MKKTDVMSPRILSKILSALLLGLLFGVVFYHGIVHRNALGKEQFMAAQEKRFNELNTEHGPPVILALLVPVLMGGVLLGAYELLAGGIYKAIKPKDLGVHG